MELLLAAYFFDAVDGVVAFGDHFHFELCSFDAVTVAEHVAEGAVAAELGVTGYEEVAKVGEAFELTETGVGVEVAIADDGRDGLHEVGHFLEGVGDEDGDDVVAVAQAAAEAGGNGVDVFEYGGAFDAGHVGGVGRLDVLA